MDFYPPETPRPHTKTLQSVFSAPHPAADTLYNSDFIMLCCKISEDTILKMPV